MSLLAAACAEAPRLAELGGATMGTGYSVKYADPGDRPEARVGARVEAELERLNRVFSTWDPDSEVSRFNAHAGPEPFAASAELVEMCLRSLAIAEATGGAFDPTVNPLVELYGFGSREVRAAPTDEEVGAALERVGYRKLEVVGSGRLRKRHPRLELTFSAIAKGAAVDRVGAVLASLGIADYMVEIGGEVLCRGRKPDGRPWVIGVEGAGEGGEPFLVERVELEGALATSGDYRNFNRGRHHIIDPHTGRNAVSPWHSVSVRADSCALADALATAFMVMGPEAARPVVRTYAARGVRALWVGRVDGRVVTEKAGW